MLALLRRILTRRDKIVPCDELQLRMVQAIMVYCIHCKEHIYYVKDESKGAVLENLGIFFVHFVTKSAWRIAPQQH